MTELGRVEFEAAVEQIKARMESAAADAIRQLGSSYSATAMRQQASQCVDQTARELLMFGGDVWPCQTEANPPGERAGNVIPFVQRVRGVVRKAGSSASAAAKVALSVVGAVAGSTLIAAATTDKVEFPGLRQAAHFVYLNNPPREFTSFVEINGQFMQVVGVHKDGEPGTVMHFRSMKPVSESLAMGTIPADGAEADVADGPAIADPDNKLSPDVEDSLHHS